MPKLSVGTGAAVLIPITGEGRPYIQNLGPGKVYVDNVPGVTTASGVQIAVGAAIQGTDESSSGAPLYVTSDTAATDVRYCYIG